MTSKNLKNFEFRLGRQGMLLFVVSMSLLLFLVFIFGVTVGMHIDAYPESIARVMPQMIRKQIERSLGKTIRPLPMEEVKGPPANEEGATEATVPPPLSPSKEEVQKAPAETEIKEIAPIPHQQPPAALDPASGSRSSPGVGIEKEQKPPATTKREKEQTDKLLLPAPTTESNGQRPAAEGKFILQVVSLKNRDKAEQFCNIIRPLGYKPRVMMVELPKKGRWFRVVIEGFKTEEEARKAAEGLSKKIKGVNSVIRPVK